MREILNEHYPGVEFLQWPGGLVASVFSNGYLAPLVVEVAATASRSSTPSRRPSPRSRAPSPASATSTRRMQIDYPELRVETDRTQAALVGVQRANAAQTTLEATLGNINTPSVWIDGANGQSYYVVTSYDGARRRRSERARRGSRCASATTAAP